ncbi:MAG: hypothetical protein GXP54_08210 [Deltaproteobacteria bacterium]|nr:hypothetical protein [Deltaproteobacteria bacterium]
MTRFLSLSTISYLIIALLSQAPSPAKTVFNPGDDPALDEHMRIHDRVFYGLNAYPFGIGLTASFKDASALDAVRSWLQQDAEPDVRKFTGKHPYQLIGSYEGANLGLRGGGSTPGTAFRYMALKQEGAPASELAAARAEVVKALKYLPVVHLITGIPHGIGRGAMLMKSEKADEPPFPDKPPELTPLFDADGTPLPPGEKTNGTNRPDNSGGVLPDGLWYWQDSCSKDQLVGWVAAMATLYDAAVDDPDIDQGLVEDLQDMACAVGAGLRVKYPFTAIDGNEYMYDLVIMDADGRPSKHHDLNPLSVEKVYMAPGSPIYNVFNLIMGLGIVKGLYHVCGDAESEAFLYQELLGKRDYLGMLPKPGDSETLDYLYVGANTNFSNVNMIAIALFLNIYFENDPEVLDVFRTYMEKRWWDEPGVAQSAIHDKQPYFHALYEAMTDKGSDPARTQEAAALLKAFTLDPYTDEQRLNCDDGELAAGKCTAIDGATVLTLQKSPNRGGHPVATQALDPSIRPPSNFDARTDPFEVNGGGGGKGLNPGGDLHAAYWIMRYLPVRKAGDAAVSPEARVHMPVGGPLSPPEGLVSDATQPADNAPPTSESVAMDTNDNPGGGCSADGPAGNGGWPVPLLLMAAFAMVATLKTKPQREKARDSS